MMAEGGMDNRIRNVLRYLRQVGDGIPPRRNGNTITPDVKPGVGLHREKQKESWQKEKAIKNELRRRVTASLPR